jgi:hypothetical protein
MIGVKLFAIETDVQKKRRVMTRRGIFGFPFQLTNGLHSAFTQWNRICAKLHHNTPLGARSPE